MKKKLTNYHRANLNAVPLVSWTLLSIISKPAVLARFRKEALSCLLPADPSLREEDLRFDLNALQANPYIHGVWNESVRLGGQMAPARVVTRDTELEGYVLRKGSVVLFPVRFLHYDESIFPEPEEFRPERWMIPEENENATVEEKEERAGLLQQQTKQRNSVRSFGGGVSICAGRFAAEKEVLSTVSAMLLLFDIELEDGGALRRQEQSKGDFKVQLDPQSLGMMNPLGGTKIKMRRRNPRKL